MGELNVVLQFFRYISERYPLTSQLIEENKIPEFDNLYLDFNAIIHNCSHPNDEDAHFRMSEEQIFTAIFAYVDLLFGKIKPKKLFFMAVDGVAPRAKMNQQRSRRFRTAKEAKEIREKAESKGEKLPDEKAFDSNCITPGTPFMVRLSAQLRYFVNKKITEDANWRGVQVVLSGHEVPGEGEHKIMEYIRLSRAQPDYNPNVRHCLYGLDADLIMLGLLSHDPHFCLLREEVKFGPAAKKKGNISLENLNFYLLHLSLMREYLDLEFRDIADSLAFDYSLERVIDDFILLAVFVGNDFLPNLPDLHIHENGLERLFDVYKKVLPSLDGYINEGGVINTKRLQVVLDEMTIWEREIFEKEYADSNWFKGKRSKHVQELELARKRAKLVLTRPQRDIFDQVQQFVLQNRRKSSQHRTAALTMPNTFPARERKFISTLAEELHLSVSWDEYDEEDQNLVTWRLPGVLDEPLAETDPEPANGDGNSEGEWEDVDDEDEEGRAAVDRVLKKFDKAPVEDDEEGGGFDARHEQSINDKMAEWKRGYYKEKLGISYDRPEEMHDLIYRYTEGLQWVMHYYYSGIASWGWFYNYHYAPRISDLRGLGDMSFVFELGKPFRPFGQLMGVLPSASMDHVPIAYQDLMYDPNSPILDFYPLEFEQDLNGKKQEWEAIVKIPFIDEQRLLRAMKSREHMLTPDERRRNGFGTSTKFLFNPEESTVYPSSLPDFFPPIYRCTCKMEPFDLPTLDGLHLVPGLCEGVCLGAKALAGFPSLDTLPHTAQLGIHGVNVHGSESRNKSMVVHVENPHENRKVEDIAKEMVGKRTFIGWPFLQEGLVTAVVPGTPAKVVSNPHFQQGLSHWKGKAERIESVYSKRCAVITGDVDVLVHVRPLKGLKRLESGALVKDYEGPEKELEQAVQMVISEVASEDPRFLEKDAPPLSEEFPDGTNIFFLGEHAYGVAAQVSSTTDSALSVVLAFFPSDKTDNKKFMTIHYSPSFKAASGIGMSPRALSKITSSFMVLTSDHQKNNLGLSIKFEAKSLKVIDYSRKAGRYWEFSEKAIDLIYEYKVKFPEIFAILDQGGDDMARATDVFDSDADTRVKEVKSWLKSKGVRDLEPVSLFSDNLAKSTVKEIEQVADDINKNRSKATIKKAIVKNIPRHAVLKPSHAIYRLQNQHFALGDRVTMVQDSGGVPLSAKGVVVGLNTKSMDVVWDVPFMSGTTLGDRCSQYRGSTVEFNSCLNLSNPQFIASTSPGSTYRSRPNVPFKPRFGAYPAIQPAPGHQAVAGFRSAAQSQHQPPVAIMSNPNRGRGGLVARARGGLVPRARGGSPFNGHAGPPNGRGGHTTNGHPAPTEGTSGGEVSGSTSQLAMNASNQPPSHDNGAPSRGGAVHHPYLHPRGGSRGRGFVPHLDRGRGRGYRGRGRGAVVHPESS
ncbi:exonuclease II [Suillus subluteus]|nr:exonuclease II [Suillus subluteus]